MKCCRNSCHKCRRESYTLWVTIFPAEGGKQVATGTILGHCWEDSERLARIKIQSLAVNCGIRGGEFVAMWRHCYGQEPKHMTRFTVQPPVPRAPVVEFS